MSSRTAVETIQAAIEKLEALKAESTPGPWHDWEDDLTNEVDVWHDQEQRSHIANCGVAGMPRVEADAQLIVTLHRTIDAQLAILDEAKLQMMSRERLGLPLNTGPVRALDLARAILGESS